MREEPRARLIRASHCRNKTALGAAVLLCIFLAGPCMRGFDPSEDGWFHVLAPCTFTIWPASLPTQVRLEESTGVNSFD